MNESAKTTPQRRSIDWISALMATVAVAALLGTAWFRSGFLTRQRTLAIGDHAPLLQLIDLDTSEPLVLAGLKGNVVWVVFWSAETPGAPSALAAIARASKQIRTHRRFSLVTAAVETGDADRVRAAIAKSGVDLPVYLLGPESRRQYAVDNAEPPLQILIDAEGNIATIASGAGQATIDRIADQAKRQLDELDPLGNIRFAREVNRQGHR